MKSIDRRTFVRLVAGAGATASVSGSLASASSRGRSETPDRSPGDAEVSIRSETDLQSTSALDGEQCLATPEFFLAHDVEPGQQLRVRVDNGAFAAFSVRKAADSLVGDASTLWMSAAGTTRLEVEGPFRATVSPVVPHPTYDVAGARASDEFVERLDDPGGARLIAVAPHGGGVEPYTDQQAAHLATRLDDVTTWCGLGFRRGGGAFDRWHVTSTAIHPRSYPKLASIAGRGFEHAVSFHGFTGEGVLIGGAAPSSLKAAIRSAVARVVPDTTPVRIADGGPYDGDSPENVVNWLTSTGRNGVQIEQGFDVRADWGREIATAVADCYGREAWN